MIIEPGKENDYIKIIEKLIQHANQINQILFDQAKS